MVAAKAERRRPPGERERERERGIIQLEWRRGDKYACVCVSQLRPAPRDIARRWVAILYIRRPFSRPATRGDNFSRRGGGGREEDIRHSLAGARLVRTLLSSLPGGASLTPSYGTRGAAGRELRHRPAGEEAWTLICQEDRMGSAAWEGGI